MKLAATREAQWIEWTRSILQPEEREELSARMTAEQSTALLERGYVWIPGAGIVWKPARGGPERRARFTHGIHFQTPSGEFYVNAEGQVRAI